MNLTYVELFAGAGGMSLGLETAGWRCVAHAEIEPHARAVLRKHWPDVPLYGDVTELDGTQFKGVTMVTGGSPCQDLSIAGKRAGMVEGSGTRSSLFFEQVRIWNESEAPYILWENVYGAFSSNAGRDFAAVLSALVGAAVPVPADGWRGAGVASGPAGVAAWRTLDAQYFGVPQRRRRVFVLGVRAGGVDPAEVLALAESLSGHLAASGKAGEGVATDAGRGATGARLPTGFSTTGSVGYVHDVMPSLPHLTGLNCPGAQMIGVLDARAVNISGGVGRLDSVMGTLDADGASTTAIGAQTRGVIIPILEATARQGSSTEGSVGIGKDGDPMFTLQATKQHGVLAFAQNTRDEVRIVTGDKVCALAAQPGMKQQNYILTYDARGNGEGVVVNALTGDHNNRVTDYTAIILRNREGKPGGGKGPLLSEGKRLTLGTSNDQVVFTKTQFGAYDESPSVDATLGARDHAAQHTDLVIAPTLTAANDSSRLPQSSEVTQQVTAVLQASGIGVPRRLTPVECERLMGWPDQHTVHGINEKGKPYALADTARYKLCGNGIASPVTAWIGFQMRHHLTSDK